MRNSYNRLLVEGATHDREPLSDVEANQCIDCHRFPDGASLSVEFAEDVLDQEHASRSAWSELVADGLSEGPRLIAAEWLVSGANSGRRSG